MVSTEGVDRPDGADPERGWAERLLTWLLSKTLPPHADNMATVEYLHSEVRDAEERKDYINSDLRN